MPEETKKAITQDKLEHGKSYRHTRPSFGPNTPEQIVTISHEEVEEGEGKDAKTVKKPHLKFGKKVFPIASDSQFFPIAALIALLMAAAIFLMGSVPQSQAADSVIGSPNLVFNNQSLNVSNSYGNVTNYFGLDGSSYVTAQLSCSNNGANTSNTVATLAVTVDGTNYSAIATMTLADTGTLVASCLSNVQTFAAKRLRAILSNTVTNGGATATLTNFTTLAINKKSNI